MVCNKLKGVFLMKKERQVIEPGTIVFFNRDVEGKELESLSGKSLTVVINGDLSLKHGFRFKGNLDIEGDIFGKQNIDINGNLSCNGEIYARDICVKGDFKTYNFVEAQHILIGGDFYAEDTINSCKITVGQCFWAVQIDCYDVLVGENFCCDTIDTNGRDISIVGNFDSDGEVTANCITVLGRMHLTGPIEADEIKVGC